MSEHDILLETGTNELEFIEFYINEDADGAPATHYFGVNVAKVLEVVEAPQGLEPAPGASHPSYLGAIPLRELILPVVDLSVWLGLGRARTVNEPIIVTEFNNVITGFLVSGVTQIHRVNWTDVEPPSRYVAGMRANCITGTVRLGERFALMLDLELALAELGAVDTSPAEDGDGPWAEHPYAVLVADDSTSVRRLLMDNFTRAGCRPETANDGEEAWNRLSAYKQRAEERGVAITELVDVVVSDVEMPRMDGYTLTRRIKEDPALSALPVVLFSSIISRGIEHKGRAVKADDQITKPEFDSLTGRVIELVARRRAQQTQGADA